MHKKIRTQLKYILIPFSILIISCSTSTEKKAANLYKTQCASCHLLPNIKDLPKKIWKNNVLPDMAAFMGIIDETNDPFKSIEISEQNAILQSGVYPTQPRLSIQDWTILKEYIISLAPDSLVSDSIYESYKELTLFTSKPINVDSALGSYTTFLKYDEHSKNLIYANLNGRLLRYDFKKNTSKTIFQKKSTITDYTKIDDTEFVTLVGKLIPSEITNGAIEITNNDSATQISYGLHRPVNTVIYDLNKNGQNEIIVSEFGNLTGELSLFYKDKNQKYLKKTLLNQPGAIRTIVKDMNDDGKMDLITLTSQGRESITILYQQEDLKFIVDPVIKFSPIYGTSWFEIIDYDGDGDYDIITVNGDNADKSNVQKPYHGLRIHINNGKNIFKESYFYSLNGATRLVAKDFDKDGDIDFGVVATFPDYKKKPNHSFIYLENKKPEKFQFKPFTFSNAKLGKWFLMDTGDFNQDGDEDIILSSYTFAFNKTPDSLMNFWLKSNVDLMILDNSTIP